MSEKDKILEKWDSWAENWKQEEPSETPNVQHERHNEESQIPFIEWADKLAENRAEGMTDYFMRTLKGIIPIDEEDKIRNQLLKRFREESQKVVSKKWLEEMTGKDSEPS